MVFGSHANTRAMYSTPPWPSLAASMAAYRRRSFSDNHPKKRCIFSSISAEYTSMIDSLSQNLSCYKDTTAQACREVIHDHILSRSYLLLHQVIFSPAPQNHGSVCVFCMPDVSPRLDWQGAVIAIAGTGFCAECISAKNV